MPSYQTLDLIADVYIPILAVNSISLIAHSGMKRRWNVLRAQVMVLLIGIFLVYGLMLIDTNYQIWPTMNLDYSTHTAMALILVLFLIVTHQQIWPIWIVSFICYILLMLYQGYHRIADVVSTALIVGILFIPAINWIRKVKQRQQSSLRKFSIR